MKNIVQHTELYLYSVITLPNSLELFKYFMVWHLFGANAGKLDLCVMESAECKFYFFCMAFFGTKLQSALQHLKKREIFNSRC